jgi:hypothetical protein
MTHDRDMTQPQPPQSQQPAQAGWSQPQPHAQSPHPGWAQQAPGSPGPRRANVLGIAAIAAAALLTLAGPAQQLVFNAAIASGGTSSIAGVGGLFTAIYVVLSLVALGLGIAGLAVRDRGRILAAAAVGIGASTLVGVIRSGAIGLMSSAL